MKKKYLLFLGLGLTTLTFGQEGIKPKSLLTEKAKTNLATEHKFSKTAHNAGVEKAGGDVVWSSDFTNATEWTIDNNGQTAPTFGWDINPTLEGWFWGTATFASTSGGNFAELGNGDPTATPATQALNVVYNLTTSAPIPLTTTNVTLSFQQWGARFNDVQEVYVSTDNLTWIIVGDNSDFDALSSTGGSEYPNPTNETIALGGLIPSSATQLYVRFKWTTGFPAQATNPNVWVAYGWLIDDVAITETFGDDIKLNKVIWGTQNAGSEIIPYYKTPVDQVQPIQFGGVIENKGFNAKSDIVFSAAIPTLTYAGLSSAASIAGYVTDTVLVDNPFAPTTTPATYTGAGAFDAQTAIDDITGDCTATSNVSFEVTDYIYARDNGTKDATISDDPAAVIIYCNQFDIFVDAELKGVDFFIDGTTPTGTGVQVSIRDISTANFDALAISADYDITVADKDQFVTLGFDTPYNVVANTSYLVCANSYGGMVLGAAGTSNPQTSFVFNSIDNSWFYTTNTPMVRMNFDPTLSTSKITKTNASVSVYPNPAKENVTVDFNLNAEANVAITLTDLAGKVIFSKDLGKQTAGQHNFNVDTIAVSNGIYVMNVVANGEVNAHKVAINK